MPVKLFLFVFSVLFSTSVFSQKEMIYEPSKEFPFGQYNPSAPTELKDYQDLIGTCKCISESRNPDQTWAKPVNMIWTWKYIMNGTAVQDETLKEDGVHSGSIRQYDKDSLRWNVHYYTTRATVAILPVWNGNKKDGKIVLYKNHTAPNGVEGFFRLTFYDISENGYKWIGEWTDKTETIVFPTWKISCIRED